jgi:hypothetical protein
MWKCRGTQIRIDFLGGETNQLKRQMQSAGRTLQRGAQSRYFLLMQGAERCVHIASQSVAYSSLCTLGKSRPVPRDNGMPVASMSWSRLHMLLQLIELNQCWVGGLERSTRKTQRDVGPKVSGKDNSGRDQSGPRTTADARK